MRVYLASSVKNPEIERIMNHVSGLLYVDFLDWFHDNDPTAWERWFENIEGYEGWTTGKHVDFMSHEQMIEISDCDYKEMDLCDIGVLILPSGNSSHMEIGYMVGKGKPCAVFFAEGGKPTSPEPMRRGVDYWTDNFDNLIEWMSIQYHELRAKLIANV